MLEKIPEGIYGLILDMDGVLWQDAHPIGDLQSIFSHIEKQGMKLVLATNNATLTSDQYIKKLAGFGVKLASWQIITSSLATADILAKRYPRGGFVYVIGEIGLLQALAERDFVPIDDFDQKPLAVVASMDREINFDKLRKATLFIRSGIPFYGTNPDRTFPTPSGLVPGAGSLLAALESATDVSPIVIGKPAPFMLELALEQINLPRNQVMVVGDRLETDISGGQAVGCPVALVLSGVTTRKMGEIWLPPVDVIAEDLSTLLGI